MDMFYIKLYFDDLEALEPYGDAERGRLFTALLEYARTGEVSHPSGNERFLFPMMKARIDRDKEKENKNKGENHWNWKGGITPKNQKERSSKEYAKWRKSVFERDGYTCQICGQHGGVLNAHHHMPWSKYKSLRYTVSNGITLCERCHKRIHKERGII